MPIPKPGQNETESSFIGRCMDAISFEYDSNEQALAVCYQTWDRYNNEDKAKQNELDRILPVHKPQPDQFRNKALTHNSTVRDTEPAWSSVVKTRLPYRAFVWQAPGTDPDAKSTWKYPHHFVVNGGELNDDGIYSTGDLYLHRGGLNAAWAAANGARSGQRASQAVFNHLQAHRRALGLDTEKVTKEDLAALDAIEKQGENVPPKAAQNNAKRGLELRREYGRGGTNVGVARARDISRGANLSDDTVRRMASFNRHRQNYQPSKKMPDGGPTAGTIAWLLWGGTTGVDWAIRRSNAMKSKKELEDIKKIQEIQDGPPTPTRLMTGRFAGVDEYEKPVGVVAGRYPEFDLEDTKPPRDPRQDAMDLDQILPIDE